MERVDITKHALLAELVEMARHGEGVLLVRDGEVVAEVVGLRPAVDERFDLDRLSAVRAKLPLGARGGADIIRDLRDRDRW